MVGTKIIACCCHVDIDLIDVIYQSSICSAHFQNIAVLTFLGRYSCGIPPHKTITYLYPKLSNRVGRGQTKMILNVAK